ncbi:hypothetical protein LCGC14_1956810, partial [marine sediment metagenome]
ERFPLRVDHGDADAPLSSKTQSDDLWDDALTGSAMQNVWLLIADGTGEEAFHCPSDREWEKRSAEEGGTVRRYGWIDARNFSYGLHRPYQETADGEENKAPLTGTPGGGFVIMADRNVNGKVYWKSEQDFNKPANHRNDGLNCLTYQGSVKKHQTTVDSLSANSRAGISSDEVYEAGDEDGTVEGVHAGNAFPTDPTDTFIVPHKRN